MIAFDLAVNISEPCHFVLFSRLLAGDAVIHSRKECKVRLKPTEIDESNFFWVYVYTTKHQCADGKSSAPSCAKTMTRLGFARLSIADIESGSAVSVQD